MASETRVMSRLCQFSVILVGVCVGLTFCLGASGHRKTYFYARLYRLPGCGEGINHFKNYLKCDASLQYCFQYSNASCVAMRAQTKAGSIQAPDSEMLSPVLFEASSCYGRPDNWSCVHHLNRVTDVDAAKTDNRIKNAGQGNTRCCSGQHQSPVDITASSVICVGPLTTPAYVNPYVTLSGTLTNNGYFPKFTVEDDKYMNPLLLSGVPFTCSVYANDFYVFQSIHIHSGIRGVRGSSHLLQGRSYDAELHIVHVHSTFYHQQSGRVDMSCASQTPLGLAVIGIFLSLTEGQPNEELNKLVSPVSLAKIWRTNADCNYMKRCNPYNAHAVQYYCRRRDYEELMLPQSVRNYGEERCRSRYRQRNRPMVVNHPCGQHSACADGVTEGQYVRPGLLLPASKDYYQYFGSLTTPPCSDVTNWMVTKEPIRITPEQLNSLQGLES